MTKTLMEALVRERERTVERLAALDRTIAAFQEGPRGEVHAPLPLATKHKISLGVRRAAQRRTAEPIVARAEKILAALTERGAETIPGLMKAIGQKEQATRTALLTLLDKGDVVRSPERIGKAGAFLYMKAPAQVGARGPAEPGSV